MFASIEFIRSDTEHADGSISYRYHETVASFMKMNRARGMFHAFSSEIYFIAKLPVSSFNERTKFYNDELIRLLLRAWKQFTTEEVSIDYVKTIK